MGLLQNARAGCRHDRHVGPAQCLDRGERVGGGGVDGVGGAEPPGQAEQAATELVSKGQGLREWLADLGDHSRALSAAAFDTRIKNPWIPGSARRGFEKSLRGHGFAILGSR
ncbi:hypothetical protein [Streptosporangium sp. LJ11]|uniref:hypothetical protein n=1 Tax=Streptosporangium sp. LJ11 TaxID=3436927 RepID=UPI003F7A258F